GRGRGGVLRWPRISPASARWTGKQVGTKPRAIHSEVGFEVVLLRAEGQRPGAQQAAGHVAETGMPCRHGLAELGLCGGPEVRADQAVEGRPAVDHFALRADVDLLAP